MNPTLAVHITHWICSVAQYGYSNGTEARDDSLKSAKVDEDTVKAWYIRNNSVYKAICSKDLSPCARYCKNIPGETASEYIPTRCNTGM